MNALDSPQSLLMFPHLYCVFSVQGLMACTTMNTCWKWLRMCLGLKGGAPGSWKTMVTMSFPMWRLRRSCLRLLGVKGRSVETWNITSTSRYWLYTLYSPVESAVMVGQCYLTWLTSIYIILSIIHLFIICNSIT